MPVRIFKAALPSLILIAAPLVTGTTMPSLSHASGASARLAVDLNGANMAITRARRVDQQRSPTYYLAHARCVHPRRVKRRLWRKGFRRLHNVRAKGRVVRLNAFRYGRYFRIKLDRCSGRILKVRRAHYDTWRRW